MKMAAIYARVSSEQQREKHTIASQTVALIEFAKTNELEVSVERILSAYQEGLVSLEQLRERMPPLRQREQALREEARAIADQANDSAMFLRLAETLTAFLTRLRNSTDTLDVMERQRIVRLVLKDVLIHDDSLVIRHCIPIVAPSHPAAHHPPLGTLGVPQIRKITFCVRGVMGPPCSAPSPTALTKSPSITPAARNARISFSTRLSLIRAAILAINLS